ncbi:MAG: DUF4198 domain-containing protein, partial [Terriglobales bacterium]
SGNIRLSILDAQLMHEAAEINEFLGGRQPGTFTNRWLSEVCPNQWRVPPDKLAAFLYSGSVDDEATDDMRAKILRVVILLMLASNSSAHDMWIVTGVPGAMNKICARIGERFPETVNAPTADRITTFQIRQLDRVEKLSGTFLDKQFCAPSPAGRDGIVEMVVHPRLNRIDRKRFAEFVRGEGLEHVTKQREAENTAEVSYLYSRYSKLIMGSPDAKALSTPIGHALEIVPLGQPSSSPQGSSFRVQVLFRGKPLANAQIAAVHEGASPEAFQFPVVTSTDKEGIAELKLTRHGLWYARLIHTIPADDPEFQWHHFFATMTFTTSPPQAR